VNQFGDSEKSPLDKHATAHVPEKLPIHDPKTFPMLARRKILLLEKINQQKADLLYNEIDRTACFAGTVSVEDRSNMNACFLPTNPEYEAEFDALAKKYRIDGIKGHRDVGGYRASMYNALPLESVQVLVDVMKAFNSKG
jgi:phosphoserine aminotransferase